MSLEATVSLLGGLGLIGLWVIILALDKIERHLRRIAERD